MSSATGLTYYPIFYFNSTTSYFGYDPINKCFVLIINSILSYNSSSIINYVGNWTFIALSAYRSSNPIFPNMFNFMIQNMILLPINPFNVYSTQILMNNLTFSQLTVSLFSNLNIANNFIFGPYGILMSNNLASKDLIQNFGLNGSTNVNCVTIVEEIVS